MEKTFEEKLTTQGVTEFTCQVEIARQLKRIADSLDTKQKGGEK